MFKSRKRRCGFQMLAGPAYQWKSQCNVLVNQKTEQEQKSESESIMRSLQAVAWFWQPVLSGGVVCIWVWAAVTSSFWAGTVWEADFQTDGWWTKWPPRAHPWKKAWIHILEKKWKVESDPVVPFGFKQADVKVFVFWICYYEQGGSMFYR